MKVATGSHHSLRERLAHHASHALVIASATLLLDHAGMLQWLDAISLRLAATYAFTAVPADEPAALKSPAPADRPVIVAIDDTLWETTFRQESPLRRAVLRTLLTTLIARHPSNIYIDLDLSPGPAAQPGDDRDAAQRDLDALLAATSKGGHTRLVLAAPLPVEDDTLRETKRQWMLGLCAAGVEFGLAQIASAQGTVLRQNFNLPLLFARPPQAPKRYQERTAKPAGDTLCDLARSASAAIFLDLRADAQGPTAYGRAPSMHPVRPGAFAAVPGRDLILLARMDDAARLPDLAGRTVFFGSNADLRDRFMTVRGEMSGLRVHAALYANALHPPEQFAERHVTSYLTEWALGVAAGWAFAMGWGRYNDATLRAAQEQVVSWADAWRPWGWLSLNLAGFVLALWLLMVVAGRTLAGWGWINPAPVIVGMFIDSLIGSRVHPAHTAHSAHVVWREWLTNRRRVVAFILCAPIVLSAWYVLATSV
ncbi:MAG: CHASE2 domain-containing protein [Casimicrobiaceae bacterium]